VGSLHEEIKTVLAEGPVDSIILKGFVKNVAAELAVSSAFVFPSELEGAAKSTFEAAACGLAQITTRESGDAVVHGETGLIIPPNNPEALAEAILHFYNHPAEIAEMGRRGRERMAREYTWDHFRQRITAGYAKAMAFKASTRSVSA
jgi:glycosyltransferase involved in cell wall biosynthesis